MTDGMRLNQFAGGPNGKVRKDERSAKAPFDFDSEPVFAFAQQ